MRTEHIKVRTGRPGGWWTLGLGIAAIGACSAFLVGCGTSKTVLQQDQAKYPQAISLYEEGCITCHGNNLQGGIGPSLQHVGSQLTPAQIQHRIEVGGGPMPAYALPHDRILTAEQISALTTWLAAQK